MGTAHPTSSLEMELAAPVYKTARTRTRVSIEVFGPKVSKTSA